MWGMWTFPKRTTHRWPQLILVIESLGPWAVGMGKPLVLMAPTDSEMPPCVCVCVGTVGSPYHPNTTVNPSENVGVAGRIGCQPPCSGGLEPAPSYTKGLCFPQSVGRGLGWTPLWPGLVPCVTLLATH